VRCTRPLLSVLSRVPSVPFVLFAGLLTAHLLVRFPVNPDARLKVSFEASLSAESSATSLTSAAPFIESIITDIPSARGQHLNCTHKNPFANGIGLTTCIWSGLPLLLPKPDNAVFHNPSASIPGLRSNITFKVRAPPRSRSCRFTFTHPPKSVFIEGGNTNAHFPPAQPEGVKELVLWSRDWNHKWIVDVGWAEAMQTQNMHGSWACRWDEIDQANAFEEAKKSVPAWVGLTVGLKGVVERRGRWSVPGRRDTETHLGNQ